MLRLTYLCLVSCFHFVILASKIYEKKKKKIGPVPQAVFSLFSFLFFKNDFEFASYNRFLFYFQNSKTKTKTKSSVKTGNFEKQKKVVFCISNTILKTKLKQKKSSTEDPDCHHTSRLSTLNSISKVACTGHYSCCLSRCCSG